jgi:hypothetical protein
MDEVTEKITTIRDDYFALENFYQTHLDYIWVGFNIKNYDN